MKLPNPLKTCAAIFGVMIALYILIGMILQSIFHFPWLATAMTICIYCGTGLMLVGFIISAVQNKEWVKNHKSLTIIVSIILLALCVFIFTTDFGLIRLLYL